MEFKKFDADKHQKIQRVREARLRKKEQQRIDREARTLAWQNMTPQEKLAELDFRLGKGKGAKKQRRKLHEVIVKMGQKTGSQV